MARAFFDHTGDLAVRLSGSTLDAIFREAALALSETLTDLARVAARPADPVRVASATLDDLLVDWLSELLYRFEVRNLLVADAQVTVRESGAGWQLDADVRGETFEPARHSIKVLVKGVTYHELHVRRTDEGWETSVVFDI